MYLVFLGPPGAGKGTQAVRLGAALGLPAISTGEMLRGAVAGGTELGLRAEGYMKSGDLVPEDVVTGIVRERLGESDATAGFLLDGYPRTVGQAVSLEEILRQRGLDLTMVIYLAVGEDEIVARLTGRRVCPGCGATYHVRFSPPAREGLCDSCDSPLEQRADDGEHTVRERLQVYRERTSPLLDYYRGRDLLQEVDGADTPDRVHARLRSLVGGGT